MVFPQLEDFIILFTGLLIGFAFAWPGFTKPKPKP